MEKKSSSYEDSIKLNKTRYIKYKYSTNEMMTGTIKLLKKESLQVDALKTLGPYFKAVWISNKV